MMEENNVIGIEIDDLANSNQQGYRPKFTTVRGRSGLLSSERVLELDGDQYQTFNKSENNINWELNALWTKHTVCSEAKYWGQTKPHRSKPISTLYSRHRNFESVPAFKQFTNKEINHFVQRISRPTTSSSQSRSTTLQSVEKVSPRSVEVSSEEEKLVSRLGRPTTSYQRRKELTLLYKPGNGNNENQPINRNSPNDGKPTTNNGKPTTNNGKPTNKGDQIKNENSLNQSNPPDNQKPTNSKENSNNEGQSVDLK